MFRGFNSLGQKDFEMILNFYCRSNKSGDR